jgi:Cu/Ag efflux pump CusA
VLRSYRGEWDAFENAKPQAAMISSRSVRSRSVRVVDGPSMIKSEDGRLRNYVTLNVRDRDIVGFVERRGRRSSPSKRSSPARG